MLGAGGPGGARRCRSSVMFSCVPATAVWIMLSSVPASPVSVVVSIASRCEADKAKDVVKQAVPVF